MYPWEDWASEYFLQQVHPDEMEELWVNIYLWNQEDVINTAGLNDKIWSD